MLTVYSMEGCSSCVAAMRLLDKQGIAYEVKKVDEDAEAASFIRSSGLRSLPQIFEGDKLFVQGGYQGLIKHYKE